MRHRIERLCAEYAATCDDTDLDLGDGLADAVGFVEKTIQTHIPYYEKLFLEWDAQRVAKQDFTEVFLGRDGVYAFIGREAQLMTRRRRIGLAERRSPLYDKPRYLTYPRFFRDSLSNSDKVWYLRDQLGDDAPNAHYFDTGFTGTIPVDIMSVMGVSDDDHDSRIRLLSATKRERTVTGVDGSRETRNDVVNKIEHSPKVEETAIGLFLRRPANPNIPQQETLEHYTQPTSPIEQLQYGFIELALKRYFTVHEANSFTEQYKVAELPKGRSARLSQKVTVSQRSEILDIFSAERVGDALRESTVSLKIANPNDPYPEEAVFETKEGLIIKRFVPNKGEGTLDEFAALQMLRRCDIPAPEPLARVFTEAEGQSGFLVLGKLNGASGRNIDKTLPDHLHESFHAQALDKMQEIAERVRTTVGIDKPWRLKDFMIEYEISDDKSRITIHSMTPIDFKRVKVFDPKSPHSVKL